VSQRERGREEETEGKRHRGRDRVRQMERRVAGGETYKRRMEKDRG
jgi:hypothetical protein